MRLKVEYLVILCFLVTCSECVSRHGNHLEDHPWSRDDLDDDIKHFLANIKPVSANDPNITRYPVILVPGDGGNQVHARLNKTAAPHYLCQLKTKEYELLWFNFKDLSPYALDCFVDNMRLVYDPETRRTSDREGVEVRILGFGDTDTVEYLDSGRYSVTGYFDVITAALVKKLNYTRGLQIRGAPYDWRRSPDEFEDYYANLTRLVEETYATNNNTKVLIIAHSMGNPVTLYWLNNLVNQAWKDKYIRSFVSLSAPWAGAAKTLRLQASGDNIDLIVVRPLTVRPYQRSATSTAFLMPSDKFWAANEVIISTPERNYSVADYEQFFNDINFPTGYEYRKNTEKLVYNLEPPHVELHALYGVGLKTPESFIYKKQKDFPDSQPSVVFGDGDGTVNLRSLLAYRGWIGKQKNPIYDKQLPGSEHVATLKNPALVEYILGLFND